jgi:hypothetical protein
MGVDVDEVKVVPVVAVVEVHIVDTIVVVAENTPPNGENRRIVDSGVLYPYAGGVAPGG